MKATKAERSPSGQTSDRTTITSPSPDDPGSAGRREHRAGQGRWPEMSWRVQPRLVNDPFSDPGVYLDFRYGRRAILFDVGDVSALSPRELLRVSHVFVSHTHVDHMAGFDRLFRLCLHRPFLLILIGPPGFAAQVEHRIRGFTWNLLDENSVDFCLRAMDYDGKNLTEAAVFHAREAFARKEFDLPPGPWLNEAKRAVRLGLPDDHPVDVPGKPSIRLGDLKGRALRIAPGQAVVYVTDAASHPENRAKILQLARAADQLFIEAVFLERDRP